MEKDLIAVLGGGNGGHAVAAELALAGCKVNFFELPQFAATFEKVLRTKEVRTEGISGENVAKLTMATTDIQQAIKEAEILFVITPAFGHKTMAEVCAPFVQDGQIILLMPGSGGSLEFAKIFRRKKVKKEITLAESVTLPYGARLKGPGHVSLFISALIVPTGVFPSKKTTEVIAKLKRFYPVITPAKDVLEAAINNPNPIVHPVATLLSATRIEHSKGEFYLYAEGMTPAVARAFESLNEERLTLCKTLGYKLYHWDNLDFRNYSLGETEEECRYRILNTSMDSCFGKDGIYAGMKMKGPEYLKDRYITEDVPYGMVLLSTLGDLLGVPTPTHDAVIQLASVVNRANYWKTGRDVKELGLATMNKQRLRTYLQEGK
ncbi:MAG TPA: NAD/NADP octopine/nopaline dehydrogenase family protein [Thermodesulfobacteriota bacterium]|nr:NAD/NADP octopine/nopaline dehydrogenase family protein [Thermodesulfobacteriota bacterium]